MARVRKTRSTSATSSKPIAAVDRPRRIESVLAKIQPVYAVRRHLKAVIFGSTGIGKTRLSATAPDVLIVDCNEKGTMSIRDMTGVDIYELEKFAELTNLLYFLEHEEHSYKTVVFDGTTSLLQLAMAQILNEQSELDASKDPAMPDKRDYGKLNEVMRRVILEARDLPMHVIFTVLDQARTDEDTEEVTITPAVTPGVLKTLVAQVDVVGWLHMHRMPAKGKTKAKTVRRLLVGPSLRYITKDRLGLYGRYVINPNLSEMIDRLGSEGQAPPDEEVDSDAE